MFFVNEALKGKGDQNVDPAVPPRILLENALGFLFKGGLMARKDSSASVLGDV